MLTRRAKAYSKLSVYLQQFRRSRYLECALEPKIAKINFKTPLFWKFRVFQSHWSWYDWTAHH